jgi:hypothetical protein
VLAEFGHRCLRPLVLLEPNGPHVGQLVGAPHAILIGRETLCAHLSHPYGGTLGAVNYLGDHGAWGWMVSPRANISTNWPMRLVRVSGFLGIPIL